MDSIFDSLAYNTSLSSMIVCLIVFLAVGFVAANMLYTSRGCKENVKYSSVFSFLILTVTVICLAVSSFSYVTAIAKL